MSMETYNFSFTCEYQKNEDRIIEGYFYITEKDEKFSPAPTFRIINTFFKMRNTSGAYIHEPFFYAQIFINGDSSSIGEAINQRPKVYTDPFLLRVKENILKQCLELNIL